jgi:hypothetical protein
MEVTMTIKPITPFTVLTVLALVTAPALVGAQQVVLKPGVERWPIKTSALDDGTKGKPAKLGDLLGLGNAADVKRNDPRFKEARIPGEQVPIGKEGDLITTTGWLHLVALEDDGDYHIQISGSQTDGNNCLIVETPKNDEEFVKDDAKLIEHAAAVRLFIRKNLLHDAMKEPSGNGNKMTHPPFVRVTGALFYDDSHVGDEPRGKKGMKAATLWELHPIVSIAFAPKPHG